jgi:uncharacterized protein YjiS (DUF1127 family)
VQITQGAVSGNEREAARSVGSWVPRLGTQLSRFAAYFATRHRAATEIRQLYRCTDRELRDVGLSRGDVPAIINGTYRRD